MRTRIEIIFQGYRIDDPNRRVGSYFAFFTFEEGQPMDDATIHMRLERHAQNHSLIMIPNSDQVLNVEHQQDGLPFNS